MNNNKKSKDVYKGWGEAEVVQLRFALEFLQAPNSNRLGLFAELYACRHCGHIVILRKEDGEISHVTIDEDIIADDPNDNQEHLKTKFRLQKECETITDGVETGDPLEDKIVRCTCNNPEPFDKEMMECRIINSFFLIDERKRIGSEILRCKLHSLLPFCPGPNIDRGVEY